MIAASDRRCILAALLLAGASTQSGAQSPDRELNALLFAGTAWSLPTPLVIHLRSAPATRWTARYDTRPLADAPYYAYRIGAGAGRVTEAELVHHKLYLANAHPPVDWFEVTHGYNLVTANVVPAGDGWRMRFGIGLVIAHPEGVVGGRRVDHARTLLGGGYHIAGVTTQLAVGRRYPLASGATALVVAPEAKLTASIARIPISADGELIVPNVAVHALAGLGVRREYGRP
jgi:hypothetical protein